MKIGEPLTDWKVYRIGETIGLSNAIGIFQASSWVLSSHPDLLATPTLEFTPNDELWNDQIAYLGHGDPSFPGMFNIYGLNLLISKAWAFTRGFEQNCLINILDTGVPVCQPSCQGCVEHPDFYVNGHFRCENFYLHPDADLDEYNDNYGHGTMMAGIVGALTNNITPSSPGIAGINHGSRILISKIYSNLSTLDETEPGGGMWIFADAVAELVNLETEENKILLYPYSGAIVGATQWPTCEDVWQDWPTISIYEDAVLEAYEANILCVFPMYNTSSDIANTFPGLLAACGLDPEHTDGYSNVITVSSYDKNGFPSSEIGPGGEMFTARGPGGNHRCFNSGHDPFDDNDIRCATMHGSQDGCHFGNNILFRQGCQDHWTWDWYAGNSAAAANIAGMASLVWSTAPDLTAPEIRTLIEVTSFNPDEVANGYRGRNDNWGWGAPNAMAAILNAPSDHDLTLLNDLIVNNEFEYVIAGGGFPITINRRLIIPDGLRMEVNAEYIPLNIVLGPEAEIVVEDGGTLSFGGTSGVDVAASQGVKIFVESGGILEITGTQTHPISLHGLNGAAWNGIETDGAQVTLDWVVINDVSSTCPSLWAKNSQVLTTGYPVDIQNTEITSSGLVIWGPPSPNCYIVDTEIHDTPSGAGLYLYNCGVAGYSLHIHDCDYVNTYLKNITGTFYDCVFEDETSYYGVLCNSTPCTPNFYCCEFSGLAPSSGPFQTTFFSATGCSPRIGAATTLNCVFDDTSPYLLTIQGLTSLPMINGHNDWYQGSVTGKFLEWRNYPLIPPLRGYKAISQYWDPSPPVLSMFTPSIAAYWNYSSYSQNPYGLCVSAMNAPRDPGSLAGSVTLDDTEQDALLLAIDLESEGEYADAKDILVDLVANAEDSHIRANALTHIIAIQPFLEGSSSWILTLIDSYIDNENGSHEAFLLSQRLRASYYQNLTDYASAIEVDVDLLESDLSESETAMISIDLIGTLMLAGEIEGSTGLDSDLSSRIPAHLKVSNLQQYLTLESNLLSQLAGDDSEKPAASAPLPKEFALYQNFPNPFNPSSTIRFDLPIESEVCLTVYNVQGQAVETLVNGQMLPGVHTVTFDGSRFSSGSYFYTLKTNDFVETKQMTLVK